MISRYRNLKIVSLNVGLYSKLNVEGITIWVKKSLDGESICEQKYMLSDGAKIEKGWNTYSFNNVATIDTSKGIYVGYTLKLKGNSVAISAVGSSIDGGLYANLGNGWVDMSHQNLGCLSIEAIIEADNLPTYDLAVSNVKIADRLYKGKTTTINVDIENMASQMISEYDVLCYINGDEYASNHITEALNPCQRKTISFEFTPQMETRQRDVAFDAIVMNLKEGDDIDLSNNSVKTSFDYLTHDFSRKVLVEEFTTEQCVNCPNGALVIGAALEDEEISDKAVALCIHAGYGTDFLTTDTDKEYESFFGKGTSPLIMYDRYPFNQDTPTMTIGSVDNVKSAVLARCAMNPHCAIEPTAEFNENDGTIKVHVLCAKDWDFDVVNPTLTIAICEDHVEESASGQSGSSSSSTYYHNHVRRAINQTWGDPISWNSIDEFEYDYEFIYNPEWDFSNLSVIAFISKKDTETTSSIENANKCNISKIAGINNTSLDYTEGPISVTYYNLMGTQVSSDTTGLILKVSRFKSGIVKTDKIINK
jgi:archaellum component FlaF (FlaF/FlaG flagellin family)